MKYMLIHCIDESAERSRGSQERAEGGPSIESWLEEMEGRGVLLDGGRLRYVSDATTVQVRHRELLVSDGPFAETKEQIAGYNVIDCADLDEAIEVASKHPTAWFGTIEVRPIAGNHCGDAALAP
ncbi:MAG TPA: YciI family protein [Streptosporangiaceae bacterium]|nr:YciI family protein [Streptosporangiaceae bacterium]